MNDADMEIIRHVESVRTVVNPRLRNVWRRSQTGMTDWSTETSLLRLLTTQSKSVAKRQAAAVRPDDPRRRKAKRVRVVSAAPQRNSSTNAMWYYAYSTQASALAKPGVVSENSVNVKMFDDWWILLMLFSLVPIKIDVSFVEDVTNHLAYFFLGHGIHTALSVEFVGGSTLRECEI